MGAGNSRKMASLLDFNPSNPHYWSADSRDALFGAHLDSLLSQFTKYLVCHPIYNDHTMNLSLSGAIYSAIISTQVIATFMFQELFQRATRPFGLDFC